MSGKDNLDIVLIIRDHVARDLKKTLTDMVVKEQLDEFESLLRERIKPLVESITLDRIETFYDVLKLRDELKITFRHE